MKLKTKLKIAAFVTLFIATVDYSATCTQLGIAESKLTQNATAIKNAESKNNELQIKHDAQQVRSSDSQDAITKQSSVIVAQQVIIDRQKSNEKAQQQQVRKLDKKLGESQKALAKYKAEIKKLTALAKAEKRTATNNVVTKKSAIHKSSGNTDVLLSGLRSSSRNSRAHILGQRSGQVQLGVPQTQQTSRPSRQMQRYQSRMNSLMSARRGY